MTHPPDAQEHLRAALAALDLTADKDEELAETPARFAELLSELTASLDAPAPEVSTFPAGDPPHDPVVLCALPFHSLCVHHLVPFFGTIDVAYIPGESIVGFGSIGRVIDYWARRPQVQERLVRQIAEYLQDVLTPRGVLVRCRARQMCMELRGAKKRGVLVSSAAHGTLVEGATRQEVLHQFAAEEVSL